MTDLGSKLYLQSKTVVEGWSIHQEQIAFAVEIVPLATPRLEVGISRSGNGWKGTGGWIVHSFAPSRQHRGILTMHMPHHNGSWDAVFDGAGTMPIHALHGFLATNWLSMILDIVWIESAPGLEHRGCHGRGNKGE